LAASSKRWRPVELDIVENNNRLILFDFYVLCKNEAANRSQQFSVSSPHGRWWQPKSRGRRAPRDGQIFMLAEVVHPPVNNLSLRQIGWL
jgi:hypothetical protein